MGNRKELVDRLTTDLEEFVIQAHLGSVTPPGPKARGLIIVERSTVEPLPAAPASTYLNTYTLILIETNQDAKVVEDKLEDSLDDLLDALHPLRWVAFQKAERAVYLQTWQCFRVDVQILTQHKETTEP